MKIITILLTFLLVACGADAPVKQSTNPYALSYTFVSGKSYQEVYRIVLNGVNSCTRNLGASTAIADGELLTEIKAADIVVFQQSVLGNKFPHINVRIDSTASGSKVSVRNDLDAWDDFAKNIKYWVMDDLSPC